jgi:hypothetical protein
MKKVYIRKWMVALLLFVVGVVGLYMCYNNMYLPAVAEKERAEKNIDLLELRIATAKGNLSAKGQLRDEHLGDQLQHHCHCHEHGAFC